VERSIDSTGYVRSVYVSRADAFKNSDANELRHDRPGRVSMQKGGGDFRLTIAPAENRALDETNIVIGQVLRLGTAEESPSTSLLREINEVPVRQPKAETSIYLALGKAAGERRILVWSASPENQKILEETPLAHVVPDDEAPYAQVISEAPPVATGAAATVSEIVWRASLLPIIESAFTSCQTVIS
jgi:hypothetical protein